MLFMIRGCFGGDLYLNNNNITIFSRYTFFGIRYIGYLYLFYNNLKSMEMWPTYIPNFSQIYLRYYEIE